METLSVYIHIPFCMRRCGYCDFNTYAGLEHLMADYVGAVCAEIQCFQDKVKFDKIGSVYFGGGTPSLLPPPMIGKMLAQVSLLGDLIDDAEITMEVNPGTVDEDYLAEVYKLGVKRLSIGVQSAKKSELDILDRQHGYDDAVSVVADARRVGFENLSLDFIYGLPNQKIEDWAVSLQAALALKPEHLSLYALTIEEGTPLAYRVKKGVFPDPDEDLTAEMFEYASQVLSENGFEHYEISNWARKNEKGDILVSKHNRQYWLNQPYLGIGAGAHGFVGGYRTMNERLPQRYIQSLKNIGEGDYPRTPAMVDFIEIDPYREKQETIFMGLRLLKEGVSDKRFIERFGVSYWEVFESEFKTLMRKGLLEVVEENGAERIKIPERGYFISNQVFKEFV
jgi:oxygen-independent coproporphyrinogen-3 oxidase